MEISHDVPSFLELESNIRKPTSKNLASLQSPPLVGVPVQKCKSFKIKQLNVQILTSPPHLVF